MWIVLAGISGFDKIRHYFSFSEEEEEEEDRWRKTAVEELTIVQIVR